MTRPSLVLDDRQGLLGRRLRRYRDTGAERTRVVAALPSPATDAELEAARRAEVAHEDAARSLAIFLDVLVETSGYVLDGEQLRRGAGDLAEIDRALGGAPS